MFDSNHFSVLHYHETDVVLNDFCLVAGTSVSNNVADRRLWFRNVFTEPVGVMDQCEDPEAPYEPRGNVWSNCGGEEVSEPATEEIPAEMPATEENEDGHADDKDEDEEETKETETETVEAPESSTYSMTVFGSACFGVVSSLAIIF